MRKLLSISYVLGVFAAASGFLNFTTNTSFAQSASTATTRTISGSRIRYQVVNDKVTYIENLAPDWRECGAPSGISGQVVSVRRSRGVAIDSFALQEADGRVSVVNIDFPTLDSPGMNRADLSWLADGLNTMIMERKYIAGNAIFCGQGPIITLNSIRGVGQQQNTQIPRESENACKRFPNLC